MYRYLNPRPPRLAVAFPRDFLNTRRDIVGKSKMPRYYLRPGVRQARDAIAGVGPMAAAAGSALGMVQDGVSRWFNNSLRRRRSPEPYTPRKRSRVIPTKNLRSMHQTMQRRPGYNYGRITRFGLPASERYLNRMFRRRRRFRKKKRYLRKRRYRRYRR